MTNFFKQSSLFYIFNQINKKKKFLIKTNFCVKSTYYDTVLKDNIHVGISNIKSSVFFRNYFFNNLIKKQHQSTFVSYFSSLEDSFFRFYLYPQLYLRKLYRKAKQSRNKLLKLEKKQISLQTIGTRYHISLKKMRNFIHDTYYNVSQKLWLIKRIYKGKKFFITNTGIVKRLKGDRIRRHMIAGLIRILDFEQHKNFFIILKSFYLILNFLKKNLNAKDIITNTSLTFFNNYIYIKFYYFRLRQFALHWKKINIRVRKSNVYFRLFFRKLVPKFRKIIKLYTKYSIKSAFAHFKTIESNYIWGYTNHLIVNNNARIELDVYKVKKSVRLNILKNALVLYYWIFFSKKNYFVTTEEEWFLLYLKIKVEYISNYLLTTLGLQNLVGFFLNNSILLKTGPQHQLYQKSKGITNLRRLFFCRKNTPSLLPRERYLVYWRIKRRRLKLALYGLTNLYNKLRFLRFRKKRKYRKRVSKRSYLKRLYRLHWLEKYIRRDFNLITKTKQLNISPKLFSYLRRRLLKRIFFRRKLRKKIRLKRRFKWLNKKIARRIWKEPLYFIKRFLSAKKKSMQLFPNRSRKYLVGKTPVQIRNLLLVNSGNNIRKVNSKFYFIFLKLIINTLRYKSNKEHKLFFTKITSKVIKYVLSKKRLRKRLYRLYKTKLKKRRVYRKKFNWKRHSKIRNYLIKAGWHKQNILKRIWWKMLLWKMKTIRLKKLLKYIRKKHHLWVKNPKKLKHIARRKKDNIKHVEKIIKFLNKYYKKNLRLNIKKKKKVIQKKKKQDKRILNSNKENKKKSK